MKVPPKGTPERREYDREHKAKSRAKKKALVKAAEILTANEASALFAEQYPERVQELDQYMEDFAAKVSEELGREFGFQTPTGPNHDEEFTVDRVARILVGLKKNWTQKVRVNGELAELVSGFYFADTCGDLVEISNRYGLKASATFAGMYRELLEMLDRRYGRQPTKAELDGTYILPPLPELPKPEPPKIPDAPSVPSLTEISHEKSSSL